MKHRDEYPNCYIDERNLDKLVELYSKESLEEREKEVLALLENFVNQES